MQNNKRNIKMKRPAFAVAVLLAVILLAFSLSGCGDSTADEGQPESAETVTFTDDCGREVEIPANITKVAPSGAVSQMVLMTIAPESLVGLSATPTEEQRDYFPEETWDLPVFGQFYGSKANLNMEALIAAQPQVILDIGDKKSTHTEDMDKIQRQTGIPTIFVEANLEKMPGAYRTLGELLNKQEKGESMASYIEDTVSFAREQAAKIPEKEQKTVYYGTGTAGLDCNADGSIQADVIDIIGAKNAVVGEEVSDKGGGTLINMEKLYTFDPDVIIVTNEGAYDMIADGDSQWGELSAVKNGAYYEIPGTPYCWMSGPPSVNRILGIWWLGKLVYPENYDYDMVDKTIEYYQLFFGCELSREEAEEMLENSTGKME